MYFIIISWVSVETFDSFINSLSYILLYSYMVSASLQLLSYSTRSTNKENPLTTVTTRIMRILKFRVPQHIYIFLKSLFSLLGLVPNSCCYKPPNQFFLVMQGKRKSSAGSVEIRSRIGNPYFNL